MCPDSHENILLLAQEGPSGLWPYPHSNIWGQDPYEAISSRFFSRLTSSPFIWTSWSIWPTQVIYDLQLLLKDPEWVRRKWLIKLERTESWKTATLWVKPWSCGTAAIGKLGDFHSWEHLAGLLGSSDLAIKTAQAELGDLPLTISSDNVCCLWLLTLTWQTYLFPLSLMTWELAPKIPSAFLFPMDRQHSQSVASLTCIMKLKTGVYLKQVA